MLNQIDFFADRISGVFLIILALVVLLEFNNISRKKELVKEKSLIAIATMGAFLTIQFIIGRAGVGHIVFGQSIADILTVTGCVAVVMGVVLNLVARVQLGSNWSNDIVVYQDQTLVQKGLFGIVRHPLYSTIFLISLGLAFQYQNHISLFASVLILLPLLYLRVGKEENFLEKHLDGYLAYEQSVPALFPFSLRKFFSEQKASVDFWAIRLCRVTTVSLLLIALSLHVVLLVALVFVLMASSAVFSLPNSFLVVFYAYLLRGFKTKKEELVDVNALRFAQGLGSFLLLCALLLLTVFHHPIGGWVLVSIVAVSTALGSLGHCVGAHIYFFLKRMTNYHA